MKYAQYVIQPYYGPANVVRFHAPGGRLTLQTVSGANPMPGDKPVGEHTFTSGVPAPGNEAVHMNLYVCGNKNSELIETIRQVHAGRRTIPRQVASTLTAHLGDETLTPRAVQVLRLVARGNRNKRVAARLSIADETVRMRMKSILSKLSANDRTHAVTIALSRGAFSL